MHAERARPSGGLQLAVAAVVAAAVRRVGEEPLRGADELRCRGATQQGAENLNFNKPSLMLDLGWLRLHHVDSNTTIAVTRITVHTLIVAYVAKKCRGSMVNHIHKEILKASDDCVSHPEPPGG
jgi:hypothetical protein